MEIIHPKIPVRKESASALEKKPERGLCCSASAAAQWRAHSNLMSRAIPAPQSLQMQPLYENITYVSVAAQPILGIGSAVENFGLAGQKRPKKKEKRKY